MPRIAQSVGGLLVVAAVAVAVAGCRQAPVEPDLRASDPAARISGLTQAGEAEDDRSLKELVYALGDDDAAVRLYAIRALKQRTGKDLGYRYYAPIEQRDRAQQRWRDYLSDPTTPAPDPAGDDPQPLATP